MADAEVVFLVSGDSPDVGVFEIGDERSIPENIAKAWLIRGICKRKRQEVAKKPKKEVSGNGG